MIEGGRTPLHSAAELEAMGFKLAIWPNSIIRLLTRQVAEFLADMREQGTTAPYLDRMNNFQQLNALLGLDEVRELEARYALVREAIAAH
jgi:2-methylisocitrate lyase-like PEP mutase family enzyme